MAVNLDAIPDKKPNIHRPITARWVMAGIVIFLVGTGLTLWSWQGERTGPKFWFTAFCLPLLTGGSLFALRHVGYKLERVKNTSRNKARELLIASETARGQRFAWLVDEFLINALESGGSGDMKTHLAAINKSSIITHCLARDGVSFVRHTALPDKGSPKFIFESYLENIGSHVRNMLNQLPGNMPCYIAFDGSDNLYDSADTLYSKIDYPLRRIRNLAGLSILDYWLDQHHDIPAALLVISAQFYEVPPQNSGEAITVLLLSNRHLPETPLSDVCIHRPQISKQGMLDHALARAMLWGKLDHTASLRGWITGGKLSSAEVWSNACTTFAPNLTAQRNVNLDVVTGYVGAAAPWQSLILAARQCKTDDEPQMIAVESAASCHQLCAVTSEKISGIV